jgi:hypothetical protein
VRFHHFRGLGLSRSFFRIPGRETNETFNSHRPYLYENKTKTSKTLFPVPYTQIGGALRGAGDRLCRPPLAPIYFISRKPIRGCAIAPQTDTFCVGGSSPISRSPRRILQLNKSASAGARKPNGFSAG